MESPYLYLNTEVFPRALDGLVDEFQDLARDLEDTDAPSEAWRAEFRAVSENLTESFLVAQYEVARRHLTDAIDTMKNRTAIEEPEIQKSVAAIRQQIRRAVSVYYDLMEAAEFQVTYLENQGWDKGLKRRARYFREDMHDFQQSLTPHGEPAVKGQLVLPNLEEERQEAMTSVNAVMWEFEKAFSNFTARIAERPALMLERAGVADLLYDMRETRHALTDLSVEGAKRAALRLRKYIGDANEKLGLPRKPTNPSFLLEVWDEPAIEGTEQDAIPTETATPRAWTSAEATYDPESTATFDAAMMNAPQGVLSSDETEASTAIPAAAPEAAPEATSDSASSETPAKATPAASADALADETPEAAASTTPGADDVLLARDEPSSSVQASATGTSMTFTKRVTSDAASASPSTYASSTTTTWTNPGASEETPASALSDPQADEEMGDDAAAVAADAAAMVARLLQGFTGESVDEAPSAADDESAASLAATSSQSVHDEL